MSVLDREIDNYRHDEVRRADAPSGEEADAQLTEIQQQFVGKINEFKQTIDAQGAEIQNILSFVSNVRTALNS